MTFPVSVAQSAKRDIRQILRWLGKRSRSGAETWYRRWSDVLVRLSEQGDTLGIAPEDADHDETIYPIIFRTRRGLPYRALSVVRDHEVFVLRVRGPGQDLVAPEDLDVSR